MAVYLGSTLLAILIMYQNLSAAQERALSIKNVHKNPFCWLPFQHGIPAADKSWFCGDMNKRLLCRNMPIRYRWMRYVAR